MPKRWIIRGRGNLILIAVFGILFFLTTFPSSPPLIDVVTNAVEDTPRCPASPRKSSNRTFTKPEITADIDGHLKYILEWSPVYTVMSTMLKKSRASFIANDCSYTNCFITNNQNFLPSPSDFDAILFSNYDITQLKASKLPRNRSLSQKYVFMSTEPTAWQSFINPVYDNFFNWTWTYRLDSNILWRYLTIYDLDNEVVGPAIKIQWETSMEPIPEGLKKKMNSKSKAAAMLLFECNSISLKMAKRLNKELEKLGWSVDMYGKCPGSLKCDKNDNITACFHLISRDYYFYLAFENILERDYVSEKLVIAMQNDAIPVVYGGADYSRFAPPGSYINAKSLTPRKLAKKMDELIHNSSAYYEYFRWKKYYRYELTIRSSEICNICSALNDETMVQTYSTTKNFRQWWNHRLEELKDMISVAQAQNQRRIELFQLAPHWREATPSGLACL